MKGNLSLALDLFEQDIGRYPTTDEGLPALVISPGVSGWKGPYLKAGLYKDPWDNDYQYSLDASDTRQYPACQFRTGRTVRYG